MTYTARAVAAVGLLFGVYALGATVIATLGVLLVEAAALGLDGVALGKLGLVFVLVALAVVRGLWSGLRRVPTQPHGVAVGNDEQPRLWAEVRDIARLVGTRPPDELRIVPEVNAAVSEESRWLGLVGGTRRMYVGAPLMTGFTAQQLRSVLAHELGHYSGRHTALAGVSYRGKEAIARIIERVGPDTVTGRVFDLYGRLYLAVTNSLNRRQELEADRFSAAVAGRDAAAASMRALPAVGAAWNFFLESYASVGQHEGRRPVSLFDGFQHLWTHPDRQEQIENVRRSPPDDETSVYDTHPSLAARIAAFEAVPADGVTDTSPTALTLLEEPERVLARLEHWMFESSVLTAVSWEELVAEAGAGRARDSAGWLRQAAGEIGVTGTLHGITEAVGAGRAGDLVGPLLAEDASGEHAADVAVQLLGSTVQAALVARCGARFALDWGGPWQLVDADSAPLDVWPLVERAVREPGGAAILLRWLDGEGLADFTADPPTDPGTEPAGEPQVLAAVGGLSGSGYRMLLVLDRGLLLKKPDWGERVAAGLHIYGSASRAMLRKALKRSVPQLLDAKQSTFLPWAIVRSAELGRTVTRRRKLTVETTDAATYAVKIGLSAELVGEPVAAMGHFLGSRFRSS